MEITTSITVPDYVYLFYQKVSQHLGDRNTEEIMASALLAYAGFLSEEVIACKQEDDCLQKSNFPKSFR